MLRIRLDINLDNLLDLEVLNVREIPDKGLHVYEVRQIVNNKVVEPLLCTVQHDQNEGAMVLASKVLDMLEEKQREGNLSLS